MPPVYAGAVAPSGPKALSLRLNFAWTSAGTVVYSACQWLTLSVLAKLGSPEMVGQYALGVAVSTPVLMLTQLNLRAVVATDVRNGNPFHDYLSLRLLTTAAALAIIAAILAVSGYRRDLAWIVLGVGVGQALDGVSDICYGWQQQHERMERIAMSMAARGVLSTVAMAAGLYLTGSLIWAVAAAAIARFSVVLGFDIRRVPANSNWRFAPSVSRQLRVLWVSLPLGIVLMLNALAAAMPRYWIERHGGLRMLGIFSAIASLVTVGGTVINALGQSATPRLARLYANNQIRDFYALLARLLGVGLGIGIAGIAAAAVVGPFVLSLAYRPEYARHNDLLIAMMFAGAIGYLGSLLGYAITATRTFRAQVP
nr:lipopolysaccharide biosynthesis protein [Acidobacteriota bacterium]